jgi:hypothetical protein
MTKKKDARFKGLTNEELIMIYYRFDKHLSGLNENLDKKMISKNVDTPLGNGIAMISVPDSHIKQFKETQYYTLLNSIVDKLKPIVELIEDCDQSVKELVEQVK